MNAESADAKDTVATETAARRRQTWNTSTIDELREMQEPGDPDIVAEILGTFRRDVLVVSGELRADAGRGDRAAVRAAAHRVRGGALTCGADRLASAASDLEHAAADADTATLLGLIARIDAERERFFERALLS